MQGLALRLVAPRCIDGVELVRGEYRSRDMTASDWSFSCRSDRYERSVIRDMSGLEDTLIVRFVNATDDDKRVAFFSRFGLYRAAPKEPYEFVLGQQEELRGLLDRAGSGDAAVAIKVANEALAQAKGLSLSLDSDGRMIVIVNSPSTFMHVEIAMLAASGARLANCENCGDVFLTGSLTGRRSTARYCRDRCRVNAHRSNNQD